MEKKKIVFIDMDGVLADFDAGVNALGKGDISIMFEEGFFKKLNPMEECLNDTIEDIIFQGYTVKILSKACVKKNDSRFKKQMIDKAEWIKLYIPCIDELNIIIQGSDECKGDIIKMYQDHECILVDDYTKNLIEWHLSGGKCIKKAKRIKSNRPFKQVLMLGELALEGVESGL